MLTIAIANHKGGTSKTTTAFNLAHELAGIRRRVLLVDLDYQSSLTGMAGLEAPGRNITQVMAGALPMSAVIHPMRPGLAIVPSDIELSNAELALANRIGRENVLRRALAALDGYDLAILDCPPSLSIMTINALAAASGVIVCMQPTGTDLRALDLFLATLDDVRKQINPGLELIGVVLAFYDARYGLHGDVVNQLEAAGIPITGRIGRSVRIAEAATAHLPLIEYDGDNPQCEGYRLFGERIKTWQKDHS